MIVILVDFSSIACIQVLSRQVLASEEPDDAEQARKTIEETHEHWKRLVAGTRANPGFFVDRTEL